MTDLLVYWRDCLRNRELESDRAGSRVWHSSARVMAGLQPGDRLWLVSSGQGLGCEPAHAGWLVEVWRVAEVVPNPGDDPRYPRNRYALRIVARVDASCSPAAPCLADAAIRPFGSSPAMPIGRLLQGPRRLSVAAATRLLACASASHGESHRPPTDSCASTPRHASGLDQDRIALGVRQPWAELILRGIKTVEVRTLPTNLRGPIYLYASKLLAEMPAAQPAITRYALDTAALPRGEIVGSIDIIDCRPATRHDAAAACVPASLLTGKLVWVLARPERLVSPVRPRFLPYGVWFYPFRRRCAAHE